jgi:uncharacterized coiled-coil protein SlyX
MAAGSVEARVEEPGSVTIYENTTYFARHTWGRVYPVENGVEAVCASCGRKFQAQNVEELKAVIAEHDREHALLRDFIERVAEQLERKLMEELEDYYVHVGLNVISEVLEIQIGAKFDEISASVEEGFAEYCEEENLSDEECEEEFARIYEEELRRINEEHAVYVAGVLTLPWATVEVSPKEVVGDYDWAGLFIEVTFTDTAPWRYASEELMAEQLAALAVALFRLA